MKDNYFVKHILPHCIAIVIFLLVTVIYFHPIVFEGKSLRQNDIFQGEGSGQELVEFREKTGEEGLWTNAMFSGMPAYLVNVYWSGGLIIEKIQSIATLFMQQPLRETFLAFLCFYILLIVFGVRPYLAIGGALAYGLGTFFLISIEAGHIWKVRAMAYMPAVLAGIHLVFNRKYLSGFVLTALALALEINSNHLQITYYLFLVILIYGIVQAVFHIKEKQLKPFAVASVILVVAALLAVGTNLGKLWTTAEYGKYSIRGASELSSNNEKSEGSGLDRSYAFRWSSGKFESFTLLVPNLYGGASGQFSIKNSEVSKVLRTNGVAQAQAKQFERGALGYWGEQPFTSGPIYAGAVVGLLFVLALFFADRKFLYWALPAIFLSIVLSWGSNFSGFNYLMFDYFPGYNKFRSVTMTVSIALMLLPLVGMVGLESLLRTKVDKLILKRFYIAGGITAGLVLLIWLFPYAPGINDAQVPDWLNEAVKKDRTSIVRSDAMRSLLFVAVSLALIYFSFKGKVGNMLISVLIGVLIVADLGMIGSRYLNDENYTRTGKAEYLRKTPADDFILKDDDLHYRVFNMQNPFNEARTSYFHSSIGGYHGAKMRRYQDLIESALEGERSAVIEQQGKLAAGLTPALNMLNAKYFVAGDEPNAVIKNSYALGNGWFVNKVKAVQNADEELAAIEKTDLQSTAIIDFGKFKPDTTKLSSQGNIELVEYRPNYLKYTSQNQQKSLVVFSEVYYPQGWTATINDRPAEIIRANYVLRALELPAGANTIEFKFEPAAYKIGNRVMMISSIILLLVMLGAGVKQIMPFIKPKA